ncbi:large ribosomal subunit protein bL17m-like [Physella acuta]|uniref:large ribosomal subunit protein bL17m-like n=1 Tax=Physella acuta TaxID=109671 RepID=UPI0027DB3E64|nr:large ribosomal subunit protein bL17m-like [Physella acuta]XP_059143351.1 large ribosomal subunit protein bL17m-like [Physella acuta]
MLRFRHYETPRKLALYPGAGQPGRIRRLKELVSGLIRYERVEPLWSHADEARQYIERLIYLAVKNGDQHKETMDIANFWLEEKDLVHKLFKVLVPRYKGYKTCVTDLHKLATRYPGSGAALGVLELRGNPYPPIIPHQRDMRYTLSNMLLSAARHDFYAAKQTTAKTTAAAKQRPATTSTTNSTKSSSVDPPSEPADQR